MVSSPCVPDRCDRSCYAPGVMMVIAEGDRRRPRQAGVDQDVVSACSSRAGPAMLAPTGRAAGHRSRPRARHHRRNAPSACRSGRPAGLPPTGRTPPCRASAAGRSPRCAGSSAASGCPSSSRRRSPGKPRRRHRGCPARSAPCIRDGIGHIHRVGLAEIEHVEFEDPVARAKGDAGVLQQCFPRHRRGSSRTERAASTCRAGG
jgi:hypothetical protein